MADRPVDPRRAATDARLHRATIQILRSDGVGAVTVEAVAARSGVAKTTIYRRYSDRIEMLSAAIDSAFPPVEELDADHPRESLLRMLRLFAHAVEYYLGTAVASIMIAEGQPAAAVVRSKVVQPRIDALRAFLREAAAQGRLRDGVDPDLAIDMIIGSVGVHYARFGTFADTWADDVLDHLWPALAPHD